MTDPFDRLKTTLADRYVIERELGAGGMATVYLAEDLKHRRKVALKVLRPDLAATIGPERFLREITVAANLQHPHVLPLYDSGEAEGFLFYVMPYVDGPSLRQKLIREGELPIGDAVRILRDVADALAYAHQQKLVHRDIKPENVMLSGRHALVTDFGVAKAVSEATGRQQLTTAGVALGTPAYMAPEQAVADPHMDHRADIYAFGALAYELLTGRPPFVGPTPQAVLAAHVTEPAEPVTQYRASIPPLLATLVMRCLEKKPADRPQSAAELLPQLEAVLTPSGGITPTATAPVTVPPPRRRLPWLAVTGVVAAAAVIGVFALRTTGSRQPTLAGDVVLVVPFENATGDAALDAAGDLLETAVKEGLQRTGLGEIRDSRTALAAVGEQRTRAEITGPVRARRLAEEIGAGLVVVGRYLRVGDSLQVEASLLDLSEQIEPARIRAARLPATASGLTLDGFVQRVMGGLAVALDPRWGVRFVPGLEAPSFESYREYRTGVDHFDRAQYRPAAESFARAFALEPDFYLYAVREAYSWYNAGRCEAVDSIGVFLQQRRSAVSEYEGHYLDRVLAWCRGDYEAALRSAQAMVRVAPRSPYAQYLAARSAIFVNRPQEAADGLRAMDFWIDEQSVDGRYGDLTTALHMLGRTAEERQMAVEWAASPRAVRPLDALAAQLRAVASRGASDSVDPVVTRMLTTRASAPTALSGALRGAAEELRWHGHPEAARRVAEAGLAALPDTGGASTKVMLLYLLGQPQSAAALADSLARADTASAWARGRLGAIAAARGDRATAEAAERWLGAQQPTYGRRDLTMWRARIQAQLGNTDRAVQLLRQAYTEGATFPGNSHADPFLEPLRDHPGFKEFVRPKG